MTRPPAGMLGLISTEDGETLAMMAASVPAGQVIIEVGAHRGLSSTWLAYGSSTGARAPVHSIDPWPLAGLSERIEDVPWAEEGAMERWVDNIASVGASDLASPIQGHGANVGRRWRGGPVGLWFHDADHSYEAVKRDFRAWLPHLAPGCWIAVHDYFGAAPADGGWRRTGEHQTAVERVILPSSPRWTDVRIIGSADDDAYASNLWIGRRW